MKRVLSIVLATLLLMSCAPLALARSIETRAVKIDTADVAGVLLPPVGGANVGNYLSYSVSAGSHFSVTSISWYDENLGRTLLSSEKFTVGHDCVLKINLKADTGYEFHTNTVCYINGEVGFVDPVNTYPANGDTEMRISSIPYTVAAALTPVANVYITEVEWPPAAGGKVSDYMTSSSYGGEPYFIYGLEWYDSTNTPLTGSQTFGYGKTYYFKFYAKAYLGYEFTSSTIAYINDDASLVDPAETYVFPYDSTQICVTSIPYTTESLSDVAEIAVSGFDYPPQEGKTAGDQTQFTVGVNAPFTIEDCGWYCEDTGSEMSADEVFEAGVEYSFFWTAKAKSGYQFTNDTEVTINGGTAIIDHTYTHVVNDDTTEFHIWTLPYAVTALEVIDEITVEHLDYPPTEGETAGAHMGYYINDEHFIVTESFWYNEDTGSVMTATDTYDEGCEYSFCIALKADEGYKFDTAAYVTINNDTSIVDSTYTHIDSSDNTVFRVWTVPYTVPSDEVISTVSISGLNYPPVTYAHVGNYLNASADAASHTSIVSVFWYDETDNSVQGANDIFHAGHEYRLFLELSVLPGYCYDSETEFRLNNGRVDVDSVSFDGPHRALIATGITTPKSIIESVSVSNVVWPPQVGAKASAYMNAAVPDNAHYSVDVITVYDRITYAPLAPDDELLTDHTYMLEITLEADEGYCFTVETTPTINGGDMPSTMYLDDATHISVYTEEAMLAQEITEVDITGVSYPPVAGETAGSLSDVQIPDDADYVVSYVAWHDEDNDFDMDASNTFEYNGTYSLYVTLYAKSGYKFSPELDVTLNGTEDIVGSVNYNTNTITIRTKPYHLEREIIHEVEVSGIDYPPVIGEKAGDHVSVTLPEDAHYSIYQIMWYDETASHFLQDDEKFTEGHDYSLDITFDADAGYEFAQNAYATLNGSTDILDAGQTVQNDPTQFMLSTKSVSAVSATSFIDLIELFGVDFIPTHEEKAGQHVDYVISDSAHYTVKTISWYDVTEDKLMLSDDTFRAGHRYSMYFEFEAAPGYYLANNLTVKISGANGNAELESVEIEGSDVKVRTKAVLCGADQLEVITEINVLCDKLIPVIGKTAGEFRACSVPADAHYRVVEVVWLSVNLNRGLEDDEVFAEGDIYVLVFAIKADEGYIFADDLVMLLNGGTDYDAQYTYHTELDAAIVMPAVQAVEAPAVTIGDVNGDGKINTADAVQILKYAAGMVQLDENRLLAGDTNHDGKVNTADAVLILKYAAGMINTF